MAQSESLFSTVSSLDAKSASQINQFIIVFYISRLIQRLYHGFVRVPATASG
jgi:hypothetical protein